MQHGGVKAIQKHNCHSEEYNKTKIAAAIILIVHSEICGTFFCNFILLTSNERDNYNMALRLATSEILQHTFFLDLGKLRWKNV